MATEASYTNMMNEDVGKAPSQPHRIHRSSWEIMAEREKDRAYPFHEAAALPETVGHYADEIGNVADSHGSQPQEPKFKIGHLQNQSPYFHPRFK